MLETHIKGPRGGSSYGGVLSAVADGAKYGDIAIVTREFTRTQGAKSGLGRIINAKFPIMVKIRGFIPTAFDGITPVFRLTEQNLDGSSSTVIANISDFAGGKFTLDKVITTDKKYLLTYTPGTGSPTAGEGYFFIEFTGPGQPAY